MSVNGDQTTILIRFLLANESRLPLSYRNEQALGAALKRRSGVGLNGEFDTDSTDIPHTDTIEELHICENDILLDRDIAALMDMDDAHLHDVLADLEKEACYLFSSTPFSRSSMHSPETVSFVQENGECTMSADSFKHSKNVISKKMYELVQEQNNAEAALIKALDRDIELLQREQEPTPQQISEVTSDARNSLMYLKMSSENRREQSITRRTYRTRRAEKMGKYARMTPDEQTRNLAELKQCVIRYITEDVPL